MGGNDYLEMAKAAISATNGKHPVHESQTWAQLSIAYSLVAICEELRVIGKAVCDGSSE